MAHAQLPATADSSVNSSDPTTNYGTSPVLAVGPTSETFIVFNLASLPPGATVQKATLVLFVDSVTAAGKFYVFPADGSWGELTLTYDNRPGHDTSPEEVVNITAATLQRYVMADVTSVVQQWVAGTLPNYGFKLMPASDGSFGFDSKENTLTSHQPQLIVELAGPEGPAGPQGIQGMQGPAGANGAMGAPGLQGNPGTNGTNGQGFNFIGPFNAATGNSPYDVVTYNGAAYVANTTVAPNGATPDVNPAWTLFVPQGATGATGATGTQGPAGPTGATGSAGSTGATGPQGPAGAAGTNGTNGVAFNFRSAWVSGATYTVNDVVIENGNSYVATAVLNNDATDPATDTANWSLMAQAGAPGAAGSQGPQGLTGLTGPQGAQGPQGSIGATGLTGPQGNPGTNGTNGVGFNFRSAWVSGATYAVNDVVTENGNSYLATAVLNNDATDPATDTTNWSLMAQAGAPGAAGATGPQGPQGLTGLTGSAAHRARKA